MSEIGRRKLIVKYRMTARDWAAFSFYHLSRSPLIWVMWLLLLLFVLQGQLSAIHAGAGVRRYVFAVAFMAVMFSAVFWLFISLIIVISLLSRRRGNILSAHTLEITDDGIVEQTAQTRNETRWAGIQKLVLKRRYLFLYVGPSAAHVIPRRAAADEVTWQEIVAQCRQRYSETRAGVR